jgi:hypothetical protein
MVKVHYYWQKEKHEEGTTAIKVERVVKLVLEKLHKVLLGNWKSVAHVHEAMLM